MKIGNNRLFLALFVLTFVASWVQASGSEHFWLSGWNCRQRLAVRTEVVETDLTNFPVLVRLNATNFNFQTASAQGNDIRFVLPDGTPLAYDRERHDSVNEDALYWVRLPLVSATQDTAFDLYYDNAAAPDGTNSHAVWTADYVGVWHLNEGPDAATSNKKFDASSSGLHATSTNILADAHAVPGMIGVGVELNGLGSAGGGYMFTPPTTIDTTLGLTFSAWAKPQGHGSNVTVGNGLINIGGGNWFPYYRVALCYFIKGLYLRENISGISNFGNPFGGINGTSVTTNAPGFTLSVWHHAVATFYYHESGSTTNTTVKIYLDGEKVGEHSVLGCALRKSLGKREIFFGGTAASSFPENQPPTTFDGIMDEVRVARTVRSDAWVKASYLNQKAVDGLLVHGALQHKPGMCLVIR